jgi:hypothetical protein
VRRHKQIIIANLDLPRARSPGLEAVDRHSRAHAMTEAAIITKSGITVDFADFAMTIPRRSQAGGIVEPNLFLALSQIITASTVQGGGKRRVSPVAVACLHL